jgi:hypothetical protein
MVTYTLRVKYKSQKATLTVDTGLTPIQLRCALAERISANGTEQSVERWEISPDA